MFLFRKKVLGPPAMYELVEQSLQGGTIVPGIRIVQDPYKGVIITVSPKVEIKIIGDEMHMVYDFNIVSLPAGMDQPNHDELRKFVGDIIVDIMAKDYCAS